MRAAAPGVPCTRSASSSILRLREAVTCALIADRIRNGASIPPDAAANVPLLLELARHRAKLLLHPGHDLVAGLLDLDLIRSEPSLHRVAELRQCNTKVGAARE